MANGNQNYENWKFPRIIIPKAIMEQCGLTDKVNLEVKDNRLIVSRVIENPRPGW